MQKNDVEVFDPQNGILEVEKTSVFVIVQSLQLSDTTTKLFVVSFIFSTYVALVSLSKLACSSLSIVPEVPMGKQ